VHNKLSANGNTRVRTSVIGSQYYVNADEIWTLVTFDLDVVYGLRIITGPPLRKGK